MGAICSRRGLASSSQILSHKQQRSERGPDQGAVEKGPVCPASFQGGAAMRAASRPVRAGAATSSAHSVKRSAFTIILIAGGRCFCGCLRRPSPLCPRSWESGLRTQAGRKGRACACCQLRPLRSGARPGGSLGGGHGWPSALRPCNSSCIRGVCVFTFDGSLALRLNRTGELRCRIERWAHRAWHFKSLQVTSWAPGSKWTRPSWCRLWGRDQPGEVQAKTIMRGRPPAAFFRARRGWGCCPPPPGRSLSAFCSLKNVGPWTTPGSRFSQLKG